MGKYLGFLLLCSWSMGQDIIPSEHGVFRIHTPAGAQGTAFVVGEPVDGLKILATAAHITQAEDAAGNAIKGRTIGGKVFYLTSDFMEKVDGGECVAQDDAADMSLLVIKMERDFTVLPILDPEKWASRSPGPDYLNTGKLALFHGYGNGKWQVSKGYLAFVKGDYSITDGTLFPGQSGGIMTVDGVICGVVSGGDSWFPFVDDSGKQKNCTWPARAGRGVRLQANLDMIENRYKKATK